MSAYYSGSSHLKKGDDDKNVNDNADADAEPDDEEKVTLLSKKCYDRFIGIAGTLAVRPSDSCFTHGTLHLAAWRGRSISKAQDCRWHVSPTHDKAQRLRRLVSM